MEKRLAKPHTRTREDSRDKVRLYAPRFHSFIHGPHQPTHIHQSRTSHPHPYPHLHPCISRPTIVRRLCRSSYEFSAPRALHIAQLLKAEMEDRTLTPARESLLIVLLQPLAPRALRKAGKGGVVLAPLNHELLEVPGARLIHPKRSKWPNRQKHSRVAHPPIPRQLARVFGCEEPGEYEMQLAGVRAKAREVREGDAATRRCCSRPLLDTLRPFRCSLGRAPTAGLL